MLISDFASVAFADPTQWLGLKFPVPGKRKKKERLSMTHASRIYNLGFGFGGLQAGALAIIESTLLCCC